MKTFLKHILTTKRTFAGPFETQLENQQLINYNYAFLYHRKERYKKLILYSSYQIKPDEGVGPGSTVWGVFSHDAQKYHAYYSKLTPKHGKSGLKDYCKL